MADDFVVKSTDSGQLINTSESSESIKELSASTSELKTTDNRTGETAQSDTILKRKSLLNGHSNGEISGCNGHSVDEAISKLQQNGHLVEDALTNGDHSLSESDVIPKMVTIITEDKLLPPSSGSSALSSPLSSPPAEESSVPSTPPSTPEEELPAEVSSEGNSKSESKDMKTQKVEDVIVIQDPTFTVKVVAPGAEPFDLQVSPQEMVQEIHQVLMDREDTCHRTCFSLQVEGNVLDNFAELKSIENLKEGSTVKVVEEPYTVREARIHVRHVRDLLKSLDPADAFNGVECQSLSFLTTILCEDRKIRTKPNNNENVDCTPPDYIMPGSKERPLTPLLPGAKDNKLLQCIKVLTLSGWNPPPGTRKMHGDLMYLFIVTMEGVSHHITASTRGFYINQSTRESFNPKPAEQNHLSHSLIELLSKVSPVFKKTFSSLLKKRSQKHPYERVPTPFQTYSWMAPQLEHSIDSIRAEEAYTARLGYEEHIPGQTRDWNEELQTTRELPRKNLPERLLRERAVFKVHSDFVAAATRGAMAVIDGNVMAINPGEDTKMQMFIWNNIFFSLGFDVRDHYKEFGGDYAAYVAPSNDLQGVKAYNTVDLEGLYTLGTVVVDYRGYRITAQSIIPGILEREQEESVIYGSIDFGKTVVSCDKYKELLSKTAQQLKILPHKVVNHKDEEVEIFTSIECKGIKGNDGRNYILDLLRTFPPDVNFLPIEGEDVDEDVKQFGFPRNHRHKLCCLRQELIESFTESRYMLFIRHAAFMLMQNQPSQQTPSQQTLDTSNKDKSKKETSEIKDSDIESNKRTNESKNMPEEEKSESQKLAERMDLINEQTKELKKMLNNDDQRCPVLKELSDQNGKDIAEGMNSVSEEAAKALISSPVKETVDSNHKQVIAKAAEAAGSLNSTDFDIRFNPDVFADGVKHAIHDDDYFKKQKKLIFEASRFVVTSQIPSFIRECLQHTIAPIDGKTLVEMLHQRGINVRYLGVIAGIISTAPPLSYLHRLVISEMIIRSVKHLFKAYLQNVGMINLSSAISHFLNCFLGSNLSIAAPKNDEEFGSSHGKKKKKSKKGKFGSALSHDGTAWNSLTASDLWMSIRKEVKEYYHYEMKGEGVDSICEKFHLQKVTLLREFVTSVGIQLLLREYDFNCKSKATFQETDILNMFPKVKHINPVATDAYNFFQSGQTKIQQGSIQDGFELISEALNLFNNVYGPMHAEIAACLRMLARLHYLMQEHNEAIDMQQKAVMMSERCNGVDHPNTITEYMHLALYCFASGQAVNSLKLMYRARYLALLIYGEDHPEMAQFDSNIGLVLHGVGQFHLSLQFLEKALENNVKFHGPKSLKAALSYHLVARVQSCKGDFRAALLREKDAFSIYREHFGENHEKTKDSSECLTYLTQQAVTMQKTMNEIRKSGPRAAMRSIPITPPSPSSVLETLNMINGIFVIPVSFRGQKGAAASDPSTAAAAADAAGTPAAAGNAATATSPKDPAENPAPYVSAEDISIPAEEAKR